MANDFGHTLVPIYITKTSTSTGTALYSVTRLVYAFSVQKSTTAVAVTIGPNSTGLTLTTTSPIYTFPALPLGRAEPMQYDLSQFKVAAASATTVKVLAVVKKAQAGNPPS